MKALIASITLAVAAAPAFALTGYLKSESTNGNLKYCTYSNGVVITISSIKLCPLSID